MQHWQTLLPPMEQAPSQTQRVSPGAVCCALFTANLLSVLSQNHTGSFLNLLEVYRMSINSNMSWQRRKAKLLQQSLAVQAIQPVAVTVWRQALCDCLQDWPAQKAHWLALWNAQPSLVTSQADPGWLSEIAACLALEDEQQQAEGLKALLQPTSYELKLSWPSDETAGDVKLNGHDVGLSRDDFEYLYALAELERQTPHTLFSAKHVYQQVLELFPKPDAVKTDEKSLIRSFSALLETLLGKLEAESNQASGLRWRNLLLSQAMRYANGIDDAEHFELHSELRQHRDLLDMMITRFEKQAGLAPLDSPAARLYRFFVADPEAIEIRHRLGDYVARHMRRVHQQLQQVQLSLKASGCPHEIIWGQPERLMWQDATSQGYTLSAEVDLPVKAVVSVPEPEPAEAVV